jgi:anti-sigma factor RsiW
MNEEHIRARFEILMLPLMNDAYNLARWLMRNQQDAEDLVQESYLRAFKFFGSFHEGTNPRAWLLRIVRNKYSAPWIYVPLALAAAMTLLFGLLFLNKSGLFDRLNTHSLVDEVIASHVRSMLATHLLDVPSTDQHTVKPWFDGKLKFAPPVHDFADHGFRLIGGRLDYLDNQEIAAVVYQRGKHIINVFVWPAESDVSGSLQSFSRSGYNIIHRNRDGFEWWAVSDVNAADLEGLAELELQGRIGFDSSYS